jgi:Serine carboxypeptidase S28
LGNCTEWIYSACRFTLDTVEVTNQAKNWMFGGLRPNVRNVFFTHGGMDPLRTLGVTMDLNEDAPAVIISREPPQYSR